MISGTYEQLVEKIAKAAGLSQDEIKRRAEAKIAKLSNLISKEGALQVVAAELGISFAKEKIKINELMVGMNRISVLGKIIRIFPVRKFKTKNADSKVVSMVIADETGNIRGVLWDTNHVALIEEGKLKVNDVIDIKNATVRENGGKEIHLSNFSQIDISNEIIENPIEHEVISNKKIAELHENEKANIRATIVQEYEPKFFFVCPECNSKLSQEDGRYNCAKHGSVAPSERALLSIVIDDGSENIRATCFSEALQKLFSCSNEELKNTEFFLKKKQELLGAEFFFTGRARKNKLFDNLDFVVQDLKQADAEEVIKELESR